MPINTLEYSQIIQKKLDEQIVRGATTGWMEANAGQVIYHGGNEIKMPSLETQGLADYDRDKGFVQGAVTLRYETYKLLMDRGRTFQLDAMDVDETNFILNATNVLANFQKFHVIPEIDAFRYAESASKAIEAGQFEDYTIAPDTVISKLRSHIAAVQDAIGTDVPLMISMTNEALTAIEDSPKLQRFLNTGDFKAGEINYKVKLLDDHALRTVPKNRFATAFQFKTGEVGQEAGGFEKAVDAKDINWIIYAQFSPIAISKTDKVRIFEPDKNQKADAWKIDYRKYHGLWVTKSKLPGIFVCTKPNA